MIRTLALRLTVGVFLSLQFTAVCLAASPERLAGLREAATISVDGEGISHVRANNEHDLYFLQGWVHARERLFQMDYNRRLASGTVAELVGAAPQAIQSDVQLRTLGLRRAAERSYNATSAKTRAALHAYAKGVNAWASSAPLPLEYGALELTVFEPWSPVDSVAIGKLISFSLSFDLDIARTLAVQSYSLALGPERGAGLFFEDLWRSAGFEPDATVPDASTGRLPPRFRGHGRSHRGGAEADDSSKKLMRGYLDRVRDLPVFRGILSREARGSSNLWAVSGALTQDGRPLIANDPHLQLSIPSTFFPMGLELQDEPVFGSTFPGVAAVIHGYNSRIAWGSTNNLVDVTDVFSEQVVPDGSSPSGLSTIYLGAREWLIPIPQVFRANQVGNGVPNDIVVIPPSATVPPVTLVMPRRDGGPIINLDLATGAALSVQYVGFGPTQEAEAFMMINRARNLEQFKNALQRFDVGSQNFVYADVEGNIAYFTTGEVPVREDLQASTVNGAPPWFVRNGQGGNEWAGITNPQPHQATPREILPFAEMPQIVNPAAGYFVNGNNDPAGITRDNQPLDQFRPGGGLFYLAYSWNRGFRAARINARLRELLESGDRRVSFKEMQAIQSDVVLRDAEILKPYVVAAFDKASTSAVAELRRLAEDPAIVQAIGRLRPWDGSTPTGIAQGYDAVDVPGGLATPSAAEIQSSIAASIYAAWRSSMIARVIDGPVGSLPKPDDQDSLAALRNLLDNFTSNGGVGASGIDFFAMPGIVVAADRRDFAILASLESGLQLLSGLFAGSTSQDDYRWGLLHRVALDHPLGSPFSIPAIPTDGGFQTVDAASHSARASTAAGFVYRDGSTHRSVFELRADANRGASIWPGGTSGDVRSPNYRQFLERWLTNESIALRLGKQEVRRAGAATERYVPSPSH